MASINGYELATTSSGSVDWKPCNNASRTTGRKGSKNYILKIYIRYPDPAGFSPKSYEIALKRCSEIRDHLKRINQTLKRGDGGSGQLAYATEIIDNKTGADQGIIEVVPLVEGGKSLDQYTGSFESRLQLAESLAQAMLRLHTVSIRHADLKLENALYVLQGGVPRAVLIDFDHSYPEGEIVHPDFVGGTDGYLAPEVVDYLNIEDDEDEELMARLQSRITLKSDIFALGVMLYLLLTLEKPAIENSAYKVNPLHPSLGGGYLSELIRAMVSENPDDRPDAEQVLQTLQEKVFIDNLPPFEDMWPEHTGYRYAEKTPSGRVIKRIRRHKQGEELGYSVTFEGHPPRVYTFAMMCRTGLVISSRARPTASTAARPGEAVVPGYEVLGRGLSSADATRWKLDEARMAASGYTQIFQCRDIASGLQSYALFKADGKYFIRSLRTLQLQQIVIPK